VDDVKMVGSPQVLTRSQEYTSWFFLMRNPVLHPLRKGKGCTQVVQEHLASREMNNFRVQVLQEGLASREMNNF
jgi:hypothetical protein